VAGVLGLLGHGGDSHIASIFGRDSAPGGDTLGGDGTTALGALIGSALGEEAYGVGGLGRMGRGGEKARVQGSLDRQSMHRVVRQHLDEIRRCQQRASVTSGRLELQLTIAPSGEVVASTVDRSSATSPQLERCVASAVQSWCFPRPKGGGMVVVSYPFVFRSAGEADPQEPPKVTSPTASAVPPPPPPTPRTPARTFWAERERIDLERFESPTGYWANTYIPGDPAIRLLRTQLEGFDRRRLPRIEGKTPRLEAGARPCSQSFDQVRGAALSLSLGADRRAVVGSTRALVQVGLQGTSRHGGRRPEMNVAVVLDWRPSIGVQTGAAIRALLLALAQARDLGDRFTLTVAGPSGLTVPSSDFRHGPLVLALQQLVDRTVDRAPRSLPEAVEQAGSSFDPDDSATALSGNLILLVATGRMDQLPRLDQLVHRHAVAGVPTSVVAVGPDVDEQQLSQLALAGQGTRRVLTNPPHAVELVDQELSAAASVVARAVRLHIRLAPGVKLGVGPWSSGCSRTCCPTGRRWSCGGAPRWCTRATAIGRRPSSTPGTGRWRASSRRPP